MTNDNKRGFYRLQFIHPLLADAKLIGFDGLELDYKMVKAALLDLSAGGARFYTDAPFPDEGNLLVELRFMALGKEFRLLGLVVRTIRPVEEHYEYCVQFSLDEADTAALTSIVNQMSIKLRKTPVLSNCSFATEEELLAFMPLRSHSS
ncbi:PilZ domain-containing protein [Paenibacillus silviterrae]|uniref:PilZ domain-containing protein n=1 Tax=Paenibacillus silviterrae TaxID=3242194 RepID=UPI0025433C51|nr:PilZ domain-containing protein [Paenibacillus chinjuensis]